MSIYDFEVTREDGTAYSLDRYRGQVLVIVNTATKCGYAPQFAALEQLYKQYHAAGLTVLGFPSNQFKQELKSSAEAATACRTTYGVTFPMHQIAPVNGKEAQPLFHYLTQETEPDFAGRIRWNFTKFLIDRHGHVRQRYDTRIKPEAMIPDIEAALAEKV
ncbi:glutathione peroxidase [Lapidilactobacillus luobeiensis]|uniref:glutathione peroxidase n=1 Tax=Lapidilactobacillus luobeiensis TaxID=2950371 RepID=UPI0021C2D596|nr:glutathione peroxidase [Lapidilactobacillus luobeiensis]